MRDEHPYSCDVCGVKQTSTKGWWVVEKGRDGVHISPWSYLIDDLPGVDGPGLTHACGITCVTSAVTTKMQELLNQLTIKDLPHAHI
jgi:hypothetical protein